MSAEGFRAGADDDNRHRAFAISHAANFEPDAPFPIHYLDHVIDMCHAGPTWWALLHRRAFSRLWTCRIVADSSRSGGTFKLERFSKVVSLTSRPTNERQL